jgi:hypothetical protein
MTSRHFAIILIELCKHFHFYCYNETIKTKLQEIVKTIQKDELTFDDICNDKQRGRDWYNTLVPIVQYPKKDDNLSCKINSVMCEFEKRLNIPLFSWIGDSDDEE